jgi:hypothetical protein
MSADSRSRAQRRRDIVWDGEALLIGEAYTDHEGGPA